MKIMRSKNWYPKYSKSRIHIKKKNVYPLLPQGEFLPEKTYTVFSNLALPAYKWEQCLSLLRNATRPKHSKMFM